MADTYTVMSLDINHADEIACDCEAQVKEGIARCVLFSMTLVPEGKPPVRKAELLCEKYKVFREKLSAKGVKNGVLIQASIGHGWILGELSPFEKYVGLSDGEKISVECPFDERFREYIRSAAKTIALTGPDHIMLDDDLRLIGRGGGGCACPLHMARFNSLAGTSFTREELLKALSEKNEAAKRYSEIFIETQKESVIGVAKAIREGIDSVNPKIPGSFCCVGYNAEFGAEIAKIMAGEENPVTVRINNGNYTAAGARGIDNSFFAAATQIDKLKEKADVILAETDTCPQNRYSTSAAMLHAHYTGTILEGASGAKQWITRLKEYEPESGRAYRKTLGKYSDFYDALIDIVPSLDWQGARIATLKNPAWTKGEYYDGWGRCVLSRLGLPMFFSSENKGILCLSGAVNLDDGEIKEALAGNVWLSSKSAKELYERGFKEYLGVSLREWKKDVPVSELILNSKKRVDMQRGFMEIVPEADGVEVLSVAEHTTDREHYTALFPASVSYKNSLGGKVTVFSGTPDTNYSLTEAFSFLNYSRKEQLKELMAETGELLAYYPGDAEMYFKSARMPNGEIFSAAITTGFDPIEKLEIGYGKNAEHIERLMADGTWKSIDFEKKGNIFILDTTCNTLEPVILKAR